MSEPSEHQPHTGVQSTPLEQRPDVGGATSAHTLVPLRVRLPVSKTISKWLYRQFSQEVCPYNIKFTQGLKERAFAPRDVIAGKDARAREILALSQEDFAAAFRRSPMKRANLKGLKRNAAVVLGNTGTMEDAPLLRQALADIEPLAREHAEWALGCIAEDGRAQHARRT